MKLTIGQMAKMNHVSEQTLRLYDKMGLLRPSDRNPSTDYRYYDIKQSAKLDLIQYMKSLGMNLKEIQNQLDQMNINDLKQLLHQHEKKIERELNQLMIQKRGLLRTLENIERYESAPPDGTIVLEYLQKRKMYVVDLHLNIYDYDLETYEKVLHEFKTHLTNDALPLVYYCNAGTLLRKDYLLDTTFYSTEVFVFVDDDFVSEDLITSIPSGNYLCIYCDAFEKEKVYIQRLLDEIHSRGYQINGDYICEVITEMPIIEDQKRSMYLRLQVPIKF